MMDDGNKAGAAQAAGLRSDRTSRAGRRRWLTVVALALLAAVAAVDRIAISLLVEPLKTDLDLSDAQIGLILGLSFWVFSILGSIPAGWMVDRFNRKRLLAVGASCWALVTMASGLASNFWQLFLGRSGVGFSEGVLSPAAFSLIRDSVPANRLGRAFGIYNAGSFIGGGVALFCAGAILRLAEAHGPWTVYGLGELKPWQIVFFTLGLGSLPFAALLLLVSEPARRSSPTPSEATPSYPETLRYIGERWRLYLPIVLFAASAIMMGASFSAWGATLIHRTFDVSLPQVGATLGLVFLFAPATGTLGAGAIMDFLGTRGVRNPAAASALAIPLLALVPAIAAPLAPSLTVFWWLFSVLMVVSGAIGPVSQMLIAKITPSWASGKTFTLFTLGSTIVSVSGAPLLVGLLSDRVFTGKRALAQALSLTAGSFLAAAAVFAFWLSWELRRDDAQAAR